MLGFLGVVLYIWFVRSFCCVFCFLTIVRPLVRGGGRPSQLCARGVVGFGLVS